MTKEQIEQAMNKLRLSFIKFDALASALSPESKPDWDEDEIEPHELTDSEEEWPEEESEPEDEDWSE